MDDINQLPDAILDSALNELPVAPLPSGFSARVIAAIHPAASPAVQTRSLRSTRFRLQFLDIALALFWSLALIVIWITTLWWSGLLRFDWIPAARFSDSILELLSLPNPGFLLLGIILIILELSVLGLIGINLLGERSPLFTD